MVFKISDKFYFVIGGLNITQFDKYLSNILNFS